MQVGFREHPALKRVRAKLPGVHMLLAPEQAHFTALLAVGVPWRGVGGEGGALRGGRP